MPLPYSIDVTIESIESETATLKTESGEIIRVPSRLLHAEAKIGDRATLALFCGGDIELERQAFAKEILKEALSET